MTNTYRCGLIGHQISYSLSKDVFQAIFSIKGIDGSFEVFDIPPPNFHGRFIQLTKDGLQGLSVTIPYKNLAMQHLHDVDAVARALGAVNSISNDSGKLYGFNTDCFGFCLPLRKYSDRLKHGTALILGCGGAAKAVVYSLYTDFEVREFTVWGRTEAKLMEFKLSLEKQIPHISITLVREGAHYRRQWRDEHYGIIVNCTPLGGCNYPDESPLPDQFDWSHGKLYYDLNYNAGNKLIHKAGEDGLVAIDGSMMLVGQAVRSFSIWTGETVPFEPVYEKVFGGG